MFALRMPAAGMYVKINVMNFLTFPANGGSLHPSRFVFVVAGSLFGKPMGSEEGLQAKRILEDHVVLHGGELMDTLWTVEVSSQIGGEEHSLSVQQPVCPKSTPSLLATAVNDRLVLSTASPPPIYVVVVLLMFRSRTR